MWKIRAAAKAHSLLCTQGIEAKKTRIANTYQNFLAGVVEREE
jgi:hypothetical protein